MEIIGMDCEGSIENKEDKVILDSDISDEEFLEDINGLDGLVPTPYYYYIDLKSSNKPLFKVNILIEKSTYDRLVKNSNLEKLLKKDFAPFHENILYGCDSVESLSESVVEVLDTDGEFKTLSSSSSTGKHAYLNESIGDYLDIVIGEVDVEQSSVFFNEITGEYRLEIAYAFDRINMKLLRHSLDGTLYELD